jgi:lipopolysaccharide/colanic/teichoic acid biosynthesis glycosyltransferase
VEFTLEMVQIMKHVNQILHLPICEAVRQRVKPHEQLHGIGSVATCSSHEHNPTMLIPRSLTPRQRLAKAVCDRTFAALLVVALLPIAVVIAVAVKLTSCGPVLFTQLRHGENYRTVTVYKFRTLYWDQCDPPDQVRIEPVSTGDCRVTPVGRFLRRTRLDELPQLLNVLKGEMSLVGPRPHAVDHDVYYAASLRGYIARYLVKPGITGWAQINGSRGEIRNLSEMHERLMFDLYYIDNWSLWFDARILLRTVSVVLPEKAQPPSARAHLGDWQGSGRRVWSRLVNLCQCTGLAKLAGSGACGGSSPRARAGP